MLDNMQIDDEDLDDAELRSGLFTRPTAKSPPRPKTLRISSPIDEEEGEQPTSPIPQPTLTPASSSPSLSPTLPLSSALALSPAVQVTQDLDLSPAEPAPSAEMPEISDSGEPGGGPASDAGSGSPPQSTTTTGEDEVMADPIAEPTPMGRGARSKRPRGPQKDMIDTSKCCTPCGQTVSEAEKAAGGQVLECAGEGCQTRYVSTSSLPKCLFCQL